LLTTQNLDEADQLASQVVIIEQGRTIATGSPLQLKRRIGGNVIEIHARDRRQLTAIANALGGLEYGVKQIDEATRRVTIGAGADTLRAALHSLDTAQVKVNEIALRQPTLDEVFLALTAQPQIEESTNRDVGAA
jgi:ABC-2 type transport system ATP-binding protein